MLKEQSPLLQFCIVAAIKHGSWLHSISQAQLLLSSVGCGIARVSFCVSGSLVGWSLTSLAAKPCVACLAVDEGDSLLSSPVLQDRQHLGLLSPVVDHDQVLYILTLGVVEGYRHQGIASALIQMVSQHAYDTRYKSQQQ